MKGKLLQIPGTEIWNGLEALQTLGITPSTWNRLRLDKNFGLRVVDLIDAESCQNPGSLTIRVEAFDYGTPREELVIQLRARGFWGINHPEELRPHRVWPAHAIDIEFFLVQPFRALNVEEAEEELAGRKVRPAYTEEILRFGQFGMALDAIRDPQIGGIVALNSYRTRNGQREYTCLDKRLDGRPAIDRWKPEPTFPGKWAFLGVRP